MAYSEELAKRVRELVKAQPTVTEKKMFGGLAFMLNGNMFCGVTENSLMARVGPDQYNVSLAKPHVRVIDFTGQLMKGYVYIDPWRYRYGPGAAVLGRAVRRVCPDAPSEIARAGHRAVPKGDPHQESQRRGQEE